jgi:hypothetical protein
VEQPQSATAEQQPAEQQTSVTEADAAAAGAAAAAGVAGAPTGGATPGSAEQMLGIMQQMVANDKRRLDEQEKDRQERTRTQNMVAALPNMVAALLQRQQQAAQLQLMQPQQFQQPALPLQLHPQLLQSQALQVTRRQAPQPALTWVAMHPPRSSAPSVIQEVAQHGATPGEHLPTSGAMQPRHFHHGPLTPTIPSPVPAPQFAHASANPSLPGWDDGQQMGELSQLSTDELVASWINGSCP